MLKEKIGLKWRRLKGILKVSAILKSFFEPYMTSRLVYDRASKLYELKFDFEELKNIKN